MSLQDWGALGELIGGVAIIVSLIYVGLQIRQSAKATHAATNQAFSAQYSDIMLRLGDADRREMFSKGLAGLKNLHGSEHVAFMSLMSSIFRPTRPSTLKQLKSDSNPAYLMHGSGNWLTCLAAKAYASIGRFVSIIFPSTSSDLSNKKSPRALPDQCIQVAFER